MCLGYDDRRPHRDRSWEGRSGSMDRERGYMHPHKEWDNDDYRPGEWGRERHWPIHDPQVIQSSDLFKIYISFNNINYYFLNDFLSNLLL